MNTQIHTLIHTLGEFTIANPPAEFFGRWEETTKPRGNLHEHKEVLYDVTSQHSAIVLAAMQLCQPIVYRKY